jgi:hypothetical protein
MLRNHGQQHVEKSEESRSLADLLLHVFPIVNKRAPNSPLPIFNLRKCTTLSLMLFKASAYADIPMQAAIEPRQVVASGKNGVTYLVAILSGVAGRTGFG